MSQTLAVIGIDIGKNSFHLVGQDDRDAIVLRQKWTRGQVEARLANMPPCLIGMEACVGAHHLSRKLKALGHDARLMPAKYVRPYSKGQKNDFRDAEAIAEAVQRPTMKFVATKTVDQLDLQALHRVRERLASQRTGIVNQIRAFLFERGVAVRQGLRFLRLSCRVFSLQRPKCCHLASYTSLRGWPRTGAGSTIGSIAYQTRLPHWLDRTPAVSALSAFQASGRLSPVPWLQLLAPARHSPKAATSPLGWAWCRSKSRRATVRSLARYRSAVTAIYASCSCKQRGSY
jgi:transposase